MESRDEEMFITCEVCDLPFTGIKPFQQHLKGKKHKKQVEHNKRWAKVKSSRGSDKLNLSHANDSSDQYYTCDICETSFSGVVPYHQHLKSRPHAKSLRRKEAEDDTTQLEEVGDDSELLGNDADLSEMLKSIVPEPYRTCSICEKQFSGPESYLQHMKSKTHAKRKCQLQIQKKIKTVLSTGEVGDSEEICGDKKQKKVFAAAEGQEELKCKDCGKVFSGSVSFAQHLISKVHQKRENKNKLLEELRTVKILQLEDDSSSSDTDEELSEVLTCGICSMAFSGPESLKAHIRSKGHKKAIRWTKYLSHKDKDIKNGPRHEINFVPKNVYTFTDSSDTNDASPLEKTESKKIVELGDKPSSPSLPCNDEECPPYEKVRDLTPSDSLELMPNVLSLDGEDKKPKSLHLPLPEDTDEDEKKGVLPAISTISEHESGANSMKSKKYLFYKDTDKSIKDGSRNETEFVPKNVQSSTDGSDANDISPSEKIESTKIVELGDKPSPPSLPCNDEAYPPNEKTKDPTPSDSLDDMPNDLSLDVAG